MAKHRKDSSVGIFALIHCLNESNGGIYLRIDEHRALCELLIKDGHDFLCRNPIVLELLLRQDQFLVGLERVQVHSIKDESRLPRRYREFTFPRGRIALIEFDSTKLLETS
jgi:hypothetical protein